MKNKVKLLLTVGIALLASCGTQLHDSSDANAPASSSVQYEGESTMRVYQVTFERGSRKPISARFDMEFTAKNGEPIADRERNRELYYKLDPDLSNVLGGGYSVLYFYYDIDCNNFVEFSDIATQDLNLFYYVIG